MTLIVFQKKKNLGSNSPSHLFLKERKKEEEEKERTIIKYFNHECPCSNFIFKTLLSDAIHITTIPFFFLCI